MAKKGGQTQTVTTRPDAATQAYVNQMRQAAMAGANAATGAPGNYFTGPITATPGAMAAPWMNAYNDNVISAVQGDFARQRGLASLGARQDATRMGAYGGDRAAMLEGARIGAVDRAEGQTLANLRFNAYDSALNRGTNWAQYNQGLEQQARMEPMWRQQQAMQLWNLGLGPTGQTQTTQTQGAGGGWLSGAAGGALSTMGALGTGNPWAIGIGAGLGALGSLWG